MKKLPLVIVFGLIAWILLALIFTSLTLKEATGNNLNSAAKFSRYSLYLVKPLNWLTLEKIPDVQAWQTGLEIVNSIENFSQLALTTTAIKDISLNNPPDLKPFISQIENEFSNIQQLNSQVNNSLLIKHLIPEDQRAILAQAAEISNQLSEFTNFLSTSNFRWLVLFQNEDELRATGGFMGSYALIDLDQGKVEEIVIEDIYDADGQFQGYVDPPSGVAEYLSSGNGLRLPDANWDPDFARSSQQILGFMALADRENIRLVTAINSSVLEDLLTITGPIFLPDYDTEVTYQNVNQVLGQHRNEFFPGSTQKKQGISHLLNQILQRVSQMSGNDFKTLAKILEKNHRQKEILWYAVNPEVQQLFEDLMIAGKLTSNQPLIYLLESNVGINKANSSISRDVRVVISDSSTDSNLTAQVEVEFSNQNKDDLGYVNYQRVIVPSSWEIQKISLDGELVSKIDKNVLPDQQELQQLGFLVTVLPGTEKKLAFEITIPQQTENLTFVKQPGLPPTSYQVETPAGFQTFLLENDTIVSWNKP